MDLYIAEKRVLAEAIASAIDGKERIKDNAIYKGDAVITWCSGHLLTLFDPEDYDERYKSWDISDLPIYFKDWKMKVLPENKKRVSQIGQLIGQADLVINCGDVDEEGQLLVDEILRFFHYSGPCKRLDTANTTVGALKKALIKMKNNKDCENDGWSAYARMVCDKMFGINLSRFYSKTYDTLLPVGRVQTPTLGMVVMRDLAIESHKKIYFYTLGLKVSAEGKSFAMKYMPNKDLPELTDGKFLDDIYLKTLLNSISKSCGKFTVKRGKETVSPPLPFNLTELNNYCGKKWGYNPDKVMKITQSLRDDFSAITYNRSDCQYLSSEHYKEAPGTIAAVCRNLGFSQSEFDTSIKSKCFNDANITAHFAIIPTTERIDKSKLSNEQSNIYDIICKYYLIQFMSPCIKEVTNVSMPLIVGGKYIGKMEMTASKISSPGFYFLLGKGKEGSMGDEKDSDIVCSLPTGEISGTIVDGSINKNETKPPQRYTQTTLYDDMTKISKYVDTPGIKRLLLEKDKDKKGENGSIGTSATRAEIIGKLMKSGFLEERTEGKKTVLISTEKGRKFYELLPDSIKKADTTALWWVVQEDIKKGTCSYEDLSLKVLDTIKEILKQPKNEKFSALDFSGKAKVLCKCPSCGGDILIGKFGPYCKAKCGFRLAFVFGKKITETQYVSLCSGKKTKISGIPKKEGKGTYSAFAIPEGVENFSYEKDGKEIFGKQLKLKMVYK